ncbi:hypothetical protein [Sandarakinorhabdus sp. DWP1-3-1]|uniref:hypothetical protein n=1 Tax=Sandarakinorhabdus sp. DWP1-3-1 TaxID=2804627 RepID=UPI003CF1542C
MALENYVVVRAGAQWRISFSGNLYGYYPDAAAATAVAIETAQKAAASGLAAAVLVECDGGGFQTAASFEPEVPAAG